MMGIQLMSILNPFFQHFKEQWNHGANPSHRLPSFYQGTRLTSLLIVSKGRHSAVCLLAACLPIVRLLESRMSQQGLWKAGWTAASLETNVHDVDIMLNYIPTGSSLFFKEIHQHCLQTYPFTQQHVFTNYYVPNVMLSPREYNRSLCPDKCVCAGTHTHISESHSKNNDKHPW